MYVLGAWGHGRRRIPSGSRGSRGPEPADGDDVTTTPETITGIVHSAIIALNEELPEDSRLEAKGATRLIGPRGAI